MDIVKQLPLEMLRIIKNDIEALADRNVNEK